MGSKKFCDICGVEEDWEFARKRGKNIYLTPFGDDAPEGMEEACDKCHDSLNEVRGTIEDYFETLKTKFMKKLIAQMKKAHKTKGKSPGGWDGRSII